MHMPQAIFDIYRLQSDGSELHVGEARSYNIAFIDVEMLASKVPAKYVIRDRETGQRHVLNLSPLDGSEVSRSRVPGAKK